MTNTDTPELGRLLRRKEVERETGLSRSSIYEKMRAGTFPLPRRITQRAVAWVEAEINAWKASQPMAN